MRPPLGSRGLKARSRLANTARHHPERLPEATRDFEVARLGDFIQALVDGAPPLTADQLAQLRALLAPSAVDGAAE